MLSAAGRGEGDHLDARFSPDRGRVFVATDGGGEQALLLALDAATGKELARYAETRPATADIEALIVAKTGDRVALVLVAATTTRCACSTRTR